MGKATRYSIADAERIGNALGINWNQFSLEQFRKGLTTEFQDGEYEPHIKADNPDALITGKIVLAHLNEIPDYYTRLAKMEKEADEFWADV